MDPDFLVRFEKMDPNPDPNPGQKHLFNIQ